jgi:hypothetical protein
MLRIIDGIAGEGILCDAEALRVIRNSPRWIPGKALIGKKVKFIRMQLSIPINFSLDNE